MRVKVKYVDSSVLQRCPASVNMDTGVVSINLSVWNNYDEFEKRFVIMHEVGHYVLDTDSEYEADAYALQQVYKTAPMSLKRSLRTLCKIGVIDTTRLDRLYREALKLDAQDGNQAAAVELEEINEQYFNHQNPKTMTKNRGQVTYPQKSGIVPDVKVIRRADGSRGHGMNGLHIGDWYLSFTNLLLLAILIVLMTNK